MRLIAIAHPLLDADSSDARTPSRLPRRPAQRAESSITRRINSFGVAKGCGYCGGEVGGGAQHQRLASRKGQPLLDTYDVRFE